MLYANQARGGAMVGNVEIAVRLIGAFILGTIIGLERERRQKPAGLRTHALVCLGSALFTAVGSYGLINSGLLTPATSADRIAAQIVSGVGFIGAGLIFKEQSHVRGLTTAASIWLTAAIGMAIAIGFYAPALIGTAIGFLGLRLHHLLRRLGLEIGPEED